VLNLQKKNTLDTAGIVNKAFNKAVKKTGAAMDNETAKWQKEIAISAMLTAGEIAKNMSDHNGDGQIEDEDLKRAAQKAGVAWDSIDPDLKTALMSGGVAGVSVNMIPLVGRLIAIPTVVGTTAYFFLVAKLNGLKNK